VLANGLPFSATFVSSTQITVGVPAAILTTASKITISVQNPDGSQSNALLFNIGQPQLQLSVTHLTRNPDNSISITLVIANTGYAPANAQMTAATLNGVGTTNRPLPAGTISTGGNVTGILTFPGTAGYSGQSVFLRVSGTYGGGSHLLSQLVTLP
jgi:hypothetical protein